MGSFGALKCIMATGVFVYISIFIFVMIFFLGSTLLLFLPSSFFFTFFSLGFIEFSPLSDCFYFISFHFFIVSTLNEPFEIKLQIS